MNFKSIFIVPFLSLLSTLINGQSLSCDSMQIRSIAPRYDLVNSLINHSKRECIYNITELTYVEKYKWLRYIPSFGWNFVSNTPFLGYNSNELFSLLNMKRRKKAQLDAIIHRINEDYRKNSISLNMKYDRFEQLQRTFKHMKLIYNLEREVFEIRTIQYKKLQITPSDYLQEQISIQNKYLILLQAQANIEALREELYSIAYYPTQKDLIRTLEDVYAD
jgi:hypothetical protein